MMQHSHTVKDLTLQHAGIVAPRRVSQRAITRHERGCSAALSVADPFENGTEAIVLARSRLSYAGFGLARS